MKQATSIFFLQICLLILQPLFGQENPLADTVNMDEFVITANRGSRLIADIPGRVEKIDARTIESMPVQNVDETLRNMANVYVNRSWGIFSQNASVTMRGLDGSSRVLVLMDGVPLNKSAGGSINWHLVSLDAIERMEVIKGPASAIYGNNAMAGVISIITKKPNKKIQGEVGILGGSYKTFGGNFNLSGTSVKNGKGFYWGLTSFYRQGEGYIFVPEESRDSTNVNTSIQEYNISLKLGYNFSNKHKLEIAYQTYDDYRLQGRQVYEELGDHVSLNTHLLRANYQGVLGKTLLNVTGFYQYENEFRQSESISTNSGKYKLSDRDSNKDDIGLWVNATTSFSNQHILTYGIDLKQGKADVCNTYYTSTDVLSYLGSLDFMGIFIQDELKLWKERIILVAGARLDFSRYYDGHLEIDNPTSNTGFTESSSEDFESSSWVAFSPKLALKYLFSKRQSVYISYSQGFMPPKLDDLSKSGKIRKGFKLANPELTPEYLTNYELGSTHEFFGKLIVKPAVYYSLGRDFQYFVGTGDTIGSGGDSPKPVYQRRNIAKVEVIGGEISIDYSILKNLLLSANYTYNHSTIKEYDKPEGYDKDITGNYLIEVPMHMVYTGLTWRNKIVNTTLSYNYISSQWYDDENTILIEGYNLIDLQLSRNFGKHFFLSLTIQNILDNEYIDRKGYLSPGRYITAEFKYRF